MGYQPEGGLDIKKFLKVATLVLVLFSALVLAACGGSDSATTGEDVADSRYVGTWEATTRALGDDAEPLEEGEEWILVLNADGTGTFTSGENNPDNFTWQLTTDGFKTQGDDKLTFKDDGDNIKTKIMGVNVIFEKQA